jgi:hypothetical protein
VALKRRALGARARLGLRHHLVEHLLRLGEHRQLGDLLLRPLALLVGRGALGLGGGAGFGGLLDRGLLFVEGVVVLLLLLSSEPPSESESGSGEAAFFVFFGGAATAFLAAGLRSGGLGAALAGFFFGTSSGSDSASASDSDSSSPDPSAEGSSYSSLSDSATTFLGLDALPLLAPARGDLEAAASSDDSSSECSAAL